MCSLCPSQAPELVVVFAWLGDWPCPSFQRVRPSLIMPGFLSCNLALMFIIGHGNTKRALREWCHIPCNASVCCGTTVQLPHGNQAQSPQTAQKLPLLPIESESWGAVSPWVAVLISSPVKSCISWWTSSSLWKKTPRRDCHEGTWTRSIHYACGSLV